jgi:hypothetical protein
MHPDKFLRVLEAGCFEKEAVTPTIARFFEIKPKTAPFLEERSEAPRPY